MDFMMMAIGNMLGLKPSVPIARLDKEDGAFGVSTVKSSDEGYETALLTSAGVKPVERYGTLAAAERGHTRWVKAVAGKKSMKIVELGVFGQKNKAPKTYRS